MKRMSKKLLFRRRLTTLIGALLLQIILIANTFFSLSKFGHYDNIVFTTKNYGSPATWRGFYFCMYFFFLFATGTVGCIIEKYRGRLYDKFFR